MKKLKNLLLSLLLFALVIVPYSFPLHFLNLSSTEYYSDNPGGSDIDI